MKARERQQWTEYVRRMEAKGKKPRKPRAKKPSPVAPAELEAGLDDLAREMELRRSATKTCAEAAAATPDDSGARSPQSG